YGRRDPALAHGPVRSLSRPLARAHPHAGRGDRVDPAALGVRAAAGAMKAAVSAGYGPPEVVRIAEVEKPTARDNEVLVKVHATTVNRTDCGVREANPALGLIKAAKIRSGQDILVHGATGAIGSAAVHRLKSLGAQVTAVCDTRNVELVKGLGADRVVDYTNRDFTTDDQKYDVVRDAVGKSTFGRCRRLLKPAGIYAHDGAGPAGLASDLRTADRPLSPRPASGAEATGCHAQRPPPP